MLPSKVVSFSVCSGAGNTGAYYCGGGGEVAVSNETSGVRVVGGFLMLTLEGKIAVASVHYAWVMGPDERASNCVIGGGITS